MSSNQYVKKVQIITAIKYTGNNIADIIKAFGNYVQYFQFSNKFIFVRMDGKEFIFDEGDYLYLDGDVLYVCGAEDFEENHQKLNPPDWIGIQTIRIPEEWTKSPPWPTYEPNNRCGKCGIEFKGAMGYVCPRTDCPSGVTYSKATGGTNENI